MRSFLKKIARISFVYKLIVYYLGWKQSKVIRKESNEYFKLAMAKGVPTDALSYRESYELFVKKLNNRGVKWPPCDLSRPLHILYASIPGNWERHNIPPELKKIGRVSCYFASDRNINVSDREHARPQIDTDLYEFISFIHLNDPVDLFLSYFSGAEVSVRTIEKIKLLGIATCSFHWDDRLHFYGYKSGDQYSGPVAVCKSYDLNLTNAPESLLKYRVEGGLAAFWPEGVNPEHFKPLGFQFEYDVSFIGARYGIREDFVRFLKSNGINVTTFGHGWEHGSVSNEEMIQIYAKSKINLGFGYVGFTKYFQCLKGRDFEVPSCGAVYLTSYHKNLEKVYNIGNEILTYNDKEDCVKQIKGLLMDDARCKELRIRARGRVIANHTWQKRVEQLIWGDSPDYIQ